MGLTNQNISYNVIYPEIIVSFHKTLLTSRFFKSLDWTFSYFVLPYSNDQLFDERALTFNEEKEKREVGKNAKNQFRFIESEYFAE